MTKIAQSYDSLRNLPAFQEDQVFISIWAAILLQNGMKCPTLPCTMKSALNGSSSPEGDIFPTGNAKIFRALAEDGRIQYAAFLERHSFLSLYKPVLDSSSYDSLFDKFLAHKTKGTGVMVSRKNVVVRPPNYRYCLQCAETSITKIGFVYARRAHQVLGVDFCPIHECALVTVAERHRANRVHTFGLVVPTYLAKIRDMFTPVKPASRSMAWKNLGKWGLAALEGKLPEIITGALYARCCESRISADHLDPASVKSDYLEVLLPKIYGRDLIASLDPSLLVSSNDCTYGTFAGRYGNRRNPIAHFLVLSALFGSVDEFIQYNDTWEPRKNAHWP